MPFGKNLIQTGRLDLSPWLAVMVGQCSFWRTPEANSKNIGLNMRSMEPFSDLAAGSSTTEPNRSLTSCIPAANLELASI
jgi:hypothetical protein